jgi:hypothetical protein
VVLQQGGILAGTVTDQVYGNPAARISIHVWHEGTNEWVGHAWTEEDGTYAIALPAGNYRIFIQSPPGSPYLARATPWVPDILVTAGIVTTKDITMEAGGRVSGRLTDPQGRGLSGVHLTISGEGSGFGTTTAEDGSFTTIAVLPGTYTLHVLPPEDSGLTEPPIRNIEILPNQTIRVDIALTAPPAPPDEHPVVYGDLYVDGQVTKADATLVLRAAVRLIDLSERVEAADVNGDGRITAADATLILRRAAGLIDRFPVDP